jgi:hypothetical protein
MREKSDVLLQASLPRHSSIKHHHLIDEVAQQSCPLADEAQRRRNRELDVCYSCWQAGCGKTSSLGQLGANSGHLVLEGMSSYGSVERKSAHKPRAVF